LSEHKTHTSIAVTRQPALCVHLLDAPGGELWT